MFDKKVSACEYQGRTSYNHYSNGQPNGCASGLLEVKASGGTRTSTPDAEQRVAQSFPLFPCAFSRPPTFYRISVLERVMVVACTNLTQRLTDCDITGSGRGDADGTELSLLSVFLSASLSR